MRVRVPDAHDPQSLSASAQTDGDRVRHRDLVALSSIAGTVRGLDDFVDPARPRPEQEAARLIRVSLLAAPREAGIRVTVQMQLTLDFVR